MEDRDQRLEVALSGGLKEGLDYLTLAIEVDIRSGRFGLDPLAGATGGLSRRHRRAVEQVGDLLEGDREHVVQDEGDALLRAEGLEHAEHRQADRVGDESLVLWVATLDRADNRIGHVGAEWLLAASLAGPQHVEADPRDHGRKATMASEKKIAVAGATGRLGRPTVEILRERGHEVVPISRGEGVDVISGEGLAAALERVNLIIDAATSPSPDQAEATEFFATAARNLQQAGAERGVRGILVVSIIGTDHFNTGYNAAKVVQEQAHLNGPVPVRILRAAQFHEFVAELVEWSTKGDTAYLPPMRTQLVAARSVAEALADLVDGADSAPRGNPVAEVAGPREESLLEAAKLLAAKRRDGPRIEAGEIFEDPEGLYSAGAVLPGPLAKLAGPTFEEWLNG